MVSKPKTWGSGEAPTSTDLNANFDAIFNDHNGNINDSDIANNAGIQAAKIAGVAATLQSGAQQAFQAETLASSLGTANTTMAYTGGTVTTNVTSVASSGISTLMTYTLPANTLTTTLRGLRIKAWGTKASSANPATVALQFGGSALSTKILPTTAVGVAVWELTAIIFRTGLSAQVFIGEGQHSQGTSVSATDAALVFASMANGTLAITETATIVIRVQATAASTTEVTQLGMIIEAI